MKPRAKWRLMRIRVLLPLLGGGTAFQVFSLSGCDPQVRDTLLAGIQASLIGLMTAIINAFFQSFGESAGTASQPVVQAVEQIARWLA